MVNILINFAIQLLFGLGILIIVAMIIELISKLFHALLGRTGYRAIIVTGFVGTPIHELGHAVMCLIFGHKIVDICLFQPHAPGGVLGYVNHSYNKRNPYHVIGNFFIAIGPILLGGAIMIGMLFALIPQVGNSIFATAETMSSGLGSAGGAGVGGIFKGMGEIFTSIFALSNFGKWQWWVFMIICLLIAMHMRLSGADIKSGWVGLLAMVLVFFVIDLIVGLISQQALSSMTTGVMVLGAYILSILTVSLILSLVQIVLALLYAGVMAIVRRVRG